MTKDANQKKIVAVRTSLSVTLVHFKGTAFEAHEKIATTDKFSTKDMISALSFTSKVFTKTTPPTLVVGYKSGAIQIYSQNKLINILNVDQLTHEPCYQRSVTQILQTPDPRYIVAVFDDSSMIKYSIEKKNSSPTFFEKLNEFTSKITFSNLADQRFNKAKDGFIQGGYLSRTYPEQSVIYGLNEEQSNPIGYFKFNCKTIADAVIISHQRFRQSFLKNSEEKSTTVLAFVNYDGYFVVFDYEKMEPRFSLKSYFGGYNALVFSPDCLYVALAGHDDCITVLNTETLAAVRIIGHRSFASRAIFQTIPFMENSIDSENSLAERFAGKEFMRVIGGGMDGLISFTEIQKTAFTNQGIVTNPKIWPKFVSLNKLPEKVEIKPLHTEKVEEAVGWIEIVDNLMLVCMMNGGIATYEVLTKKPEKSPLREEELRLAQRNGDGDTSDSLHQAATEKNSKNESFQANSTAHDPIKSTSTDS